MHNIKLFLNSHISSALVSNPQKNMNGMVTLKHMYKSIKN